MIIKDGQTPEGRKLKRKVQHVYLKPLTTREMTPEEWEQYGLPVKPEQFEEPPLLASLGNKESRYPLDPGFSKRVHEERIKREFNIKQMASLVGIPYGTYKNIETCRYGLNPKLKETICKALGWKE